MYQVLQVKPCFIYDDTNHYCNNSMWIIPKNDKFLVGLLNSKMGWWLISKYCTAIQNGFQLIWKYFGQIPIKNISEKEKKPFIELVDKIIAQKQKGEDTKADETLIDKMVYELYNITAEEQQLIERK
jgi:adenine-specific DNA-methyltransferase